MTKKTETKNRIEALQTAYTLEEAQEALQISRRTALRYIYSGQLKAAKVGGKWRITREALDAFLQKRGI